MRLCVSIAGPDKETACAQIDKVREDVDLVELRLDCFHRIVPEEVREVMERAEKAELLVLLTLRGVVCEDGLLKDLARLESAYFDVDFGLEEAIQEKVRLIREVSPKTQIILSVHDFSGDLPDTDTLLQSMQMEGVALYKVARHVETSVEALDLLRTMSKSDNLIAVAMGEEGVTSRILSPLVGDGGGDLWTFAAVDEEHTTAPGQLSVQTLVDNYRFRELSPQTAVMGLIGDPVELSPSHRTHNKVLRSLGLDGVYVKWRVAPSDLEAFFAASTFLPLKGLSVTMPHKERVIDHLDEVDSSARSIGAVNTIAFRDGEKIGYNTDGIGFLDAIEERLLVAGKHVVVLGAGGVARAIIFEAERRGARVTVLNRTQKNSEIRPLDEIGDVAEAGYDVLVNATSVGMGLHAYTTPIDSCHLLPGAIIVDVVAHPRVTRLLTDATLCGCQTISGVEGFINQAAEQFAIWYGDSIEQSMLKTIVKTFLSQDLLCPPIQSEKAISPAS